jgi:hypothetical protein
MARKRRPVVEIVDEPIVIDVHAVSNFAFNAGLTVEAAQVLLEEADDWRVVAGVCREHCGGESSFVVAVRAFADRDVIYCEGCNVADLWV